jgi:hypothetical protein
MRVYFDLENISVMNADSPLVIELEIANRDLEYQSLFNAACDAYNKLMLARTCKHCHGSGVHIWSDASVGLVDEIEPCLCTTDGICPVCGAPLTDAMVPSCTQCHFQYNEFNALCAHAQDEYE